MVSDWQLQHGLPVLASWQWWVHSSLVMLPFTIWQRKARSSCLTERPRFRSWKPACTRNRMSTISDKLASTWGGGPTTRLTFFFTKTSMALVILANTPCCRWSWAML